MHQNQFQSNVLIKWVASVYQILLLAEKKSFGLGDVVVRWVAAYLPGRVSNVHISREFSGTLSMRSGVPQGSVIAPKLFLLFVNDFPGPLEAVTLFFVDNVKMVTPRTRTYLYLLVLASAFTRGGLSRHHQSRWPRLGRRHSRLGGPVRAH